MSPLDKEGGEVQKTANHTVQAVGGRKSASSCSKMPPVLRERQ